MVLRRPFRWLIATAAASLALAFAVPPAAALAASPPVIESVALSHLTPTDATLEAKINTEDLETEYAFRLWSSPCSKKGEGCELMREVKLPTGERLYGSLETQSVSLDLNSAGVMLGGGEYGFTVVAANREGSASAFGGVFEAPESVSEGPEEGPFESQPPPVPAVALPAAPSGGGQSVDSQISSSSGSQTVDTTSSTSAITDGAATHGMKPEVHKGKHKKHKHHKAQAGKRR